MSFLAKWKTVKKNFEKETGHKKPSEKFLGIFNKPSGMEAALKAVDAALTKKDPTAAAEAHEEFAATKATYWELVKKHWDFSHDPAMQRFRIGLDGLERATKHAAKDLLTAGDAKVTIAEAIGDKAVQQFGESLKFKDGMKAWIYEPQGAGILLEGKILRVPGCIKAWNEAKTQLEHITKVHNVLAKALPKKTERAKGLKLAQSYHDAMAEVLDENGGLPGQIGLWLDAAKAAYEKLAEAKKIPNARTAMNAWRENSKAFKLLQNNGYWWDAERATNAKFLKALPNIK